MPREAALDKRILTWLRSLPDCHAEKIHGTVYGYTGRPDIIGCYRGCMVVIEDKSKGRKPTAIQEHRLAQWATAGAFVWWGESLEALQEAWREEFGDESEPEHAYWRCGKADCTKCYPR